MNCAERLLTRLGAFLGREINPADRPDGGEQQEGSRFGSESLTLAVILRTWDEGPQAYPEELRNTPLHLPQSMKSRLVPMAANAR